MNLARWTIGRKAFAFLTKRGILRAVLICSLGASGFIAWRLCIQDWKSLFSQALTNNPKAENLFPSVQLSDGTQITYVGTSRGIPTGEVENGHPLYHHSGIPRDTKRFRSRKPERSTTETFFETTSPFELAIRVKLTNRPKQKELDWALGWNVHVIDDNGWASGSDGIVDMLNNFNYENTDTGLMQVAGPYPRHSKFIGLRFSSRKENNAHSVAELKLENPFYEGPASAVEGRAKPNKSQQFRAGELVLTKLYRRAKIAPTGETGGMWGDFAVNPTLSSFTDYDLVLTDVTDRSGQWLGHTIGARGHSGRFNSRYEGKNGRLRLYFPRAPWSDDSEWITKAQVFRRDFLEYATEAEKYRFDHLPVPTGEGPITVDQVVNKNGITLKLTALIRTDNRWGFEMEGWLKGHVLDHRLLIQEVHDDKNRTGKPTKDVGGYSIFENDCMATSTYPNTEKSYFMLRLEPDAKWWGVTIVPDIVENIEFHVPTREIGEMRK